MTFIPAFTTHAMTQDFLSFPPNEWRCSWLPSYGIYISLLIRFVKCYTRLLDLHSKNYKSFPNFYHRETDIASFVRLLVSYSELLSKFGVIPLQDDVTKGIPHTVLHGNVLYKLKGSRVQIISFPREQKSKTPSTSTVWPTDNREDNRSCTRPSTVMYRLFLKPRPWGIKGEYLNFLPSLSQASKSFTPFICVYIAR